ncbi:MAG: RNA-guided endonuclease InsQ/TnpB family protein [Promethearchaeota archaeon]
MSAHLAKTHSLIVVEDLWIHGLIKNTHLSKYWVDLAHGEFQRMLDYKAKLHGSTVIEADRFFPSSKLCSTCLYYNPDLTLDERVYQCPLYGLELDWDFNASLNLEHYYYIYHQVIAPVAKSSEETLNAGRETVSLPHRKQASMKQEAKHEMF